MIESFFGRSAILEYEFHYTSPNTGWITNRAERSHSRGTLSLKSTVRLLSSQILTLIVKLVKGDNCWSNKIYMGVVSDVNVVVKYNL